MKQELAARLAEFARLVARRIVIRQDGRIEGGPGSRWRARCATSPTLPTVGVGTAVQFSLVRLSGRMVARMIKASLVLVKRWLFSPYPGLDPPCDPMDEKRAH